MILLYKYIVGSTTLAEFISYFENCGGEEMTPLSIGMDYSIWI